MNLNVVANKMANQTKYVVNQFVTFEIAEGVYLPGTIDAISEDGNVLYITDSDGAEHEVNTKNRDVIVA